MPEWREFPTSTEVGSAKISRKPHGTAFHNSQQSHHVHF
jgi:hypothetical protein